MQTEENNMQTEGINMQTEGINMQTDESLQSAVVRTLRQLANVACSLGSTPANRPVTNTTDHTNVALVVSPRLTTMID